MIVSWLLNDLNICQVLVFHNKCFSTQINSRSFFTSQFFVYLHSQSMCLQATSPMMNCLEPAHVTFLISLRSQVLNRFNKETNSWASSINCETRWPQKLVYLGSTGDIICNVFEIFHESQYWGQDESHISCLFMPTNLPNFFTWS